MEPHLYPIEEERGKEIERKKREVWVGGGEKRPFICFYRHSLKSNDDRVGWGIEGQDRGV